MSILNKGREIDTEDSFNKLTEVINSFYVPENVKQKSDITVKQSMQFARLDYRTKIEIEEFGYQSTLDKDIVEAVELRSASYNREGRTEALQAVSALLQQTLARSSRILGRMFGA